MWKKALTALRRSKAVSFAFPVLCAMLFRGVFRASDVPEAMRGLMAATPLPEALLVFLISLSLGLATGSVMLPLAISLPVGATLAEGVIAYTGAVVGYIISPLHLCFIVTAEYFRMEQAEMYPRLVAYLALACSTSLPLILLLAPFLP